MATPRTEAGRENGKYVRFPVPLPADPALSAVATHQHGVVGLSQLTGLGLSAAAVHKRCQAARLHRVHHGVYAIMPPALLSREGRWLAAVLACGLHAVLSHASAAALHELRASSAVFIDVTVPTRSPRAHPGLRVHRSTSLAPADVTRIDGIPCTTVARTLLDLGEQVTRRALERACDQAEILQVLNLRALEDQLARNPRRRAAGLLTAVLAEHHIGQTPTLSELEEAFLALVRRAGLPLPEVNALLDLGDGEPPLRPDFLWRRERLIVETDGRATHATQQAFDRDRRRDQRATIAGWRPVRIGWRPIVRDGARVERMLVALLNRG